MNSTIEGVAGALPRPLALRDLLSHEEFGLTLVTEDDSLLDREIAGAHVAEFDHPARWVGEDWVMLTTGLRLRSRAAQMGLVRELVEQRVAGLGISLDIQFKNAPRALIEEANRLCLPVFSIPLPTAGKDIVTFISQSRLDRDAYMLRRAFSIQRYLMEALQSEEPEAALVKRLASVAQASVFLLDSAGTLVTSEGHAPAAEIWAELPHDPVDMRQAMVGPWAAISAPLRTGDELTGWLVVAMRSRETFQQLARAAVEAAHRLFGLIGLMRHAALTDERAVKASLLRDLLDSHATPNTSGVSERLGARGFAPDSPSRILVAVEWRSSGGSAAAWLSPAEALFGVRNRPALLLEEKGSLIALVSDDGGVRDDAMALCEALREGADPVIAIGGPVAADGAFTDSLRDARLVVAWSRRNMTERVIGVEDIDLIGLTLGLPGIDSIMPRSEELLALLAERPNLLETLSTYFDCHCDVNRAAKRLHLHPNSVRYRLTQVEEAVGLRLADPAAVANLYLALELRDSTPSLRR